MDGDNNDGDDGDGDGDDDHDGDNNVVSEPGRFDVETACGTAAIDIGIGQLQNIEF